MNRNSTAAKAQARLWEGLTNLVRECWQRVWRAYLEVTGDARRLVL